jgi:hypothetical protein
MSTKTIAAVLAALTGTGLTLSCDKQGSDSTEIPGQADASKDTNAGENACGNHAEGACGAASSAPPTTGANTRAIKIAPGTFAEANFTMTKGSTFSATFTDGSTDIAWDIHSHDHSGGTEFHDQGAGGDGTVEFTAPADGVFSVLWKNGGSAPTTLNIALTLGKGASVHSWHPED